LVAGATIALTRRFSVDQPPTPDDRNHKLRQCTMVPMPPFAGEFEQRFGMRMTSVYALSDYGIGTLLGPDHPPDKKRSAGLPARDVEVAILDDDDLPLPAGQAGEIALRAREPWTASQGYWNMPEATVAARRNLWFHTGDRGYLDGDGYLFFVDRKKDAIRRRGENISSWEIEQILQAHPAIAEVAAYPVRAESEDDVMVSVVLRPGIALDAAGLIAYCQEHMAYYMVPRYVEFLAALPRTLTEKVEKYKLRADAEQRLSQVWDRERAGIVVRR
jgi:crotonobetaine/carnitine-CoA ligase